MRTKPKSKRVTLTIVHDWIADRDIDEPYIVLRIDDYAMDPADRGQFYPENARMDDKQKAIWPNRASAQSAAEWATRKFGHQYAIFKMVAIVQTAVAPIKVWEV